MWSAPGGGRGARNGRAPTPNGDETPTLSDVRRRVRGSLSREPTGSGADWGSRGHAHDVWPKSCSLAGGDPGARGRDDGLRAAERGLYATARLRSRRCGRSRGGEGRGGTPWREIRWIDRTVKQHHPRCHVLRCRHAVWLGHGVHGHGTRPPHVPDCVTVAGTRLRDGPRGRGWRLRSQGGLRRHGAGCCRLGKDAGAGGGLGRVRRVLPIVLVLCNGSTSQSGAPCWPRWAISR
jgi:hypothetical protein